MLDEANLQKSLSKALCHVAEETILYLRVECPFSKKLWNAPARWCDYHYRIKISFDLDPKSIILNYFDGNQKEMINAPDLRMKRYIHVCKCYKQLPNFNSFVNQINHTIKVERCTALVNGKLRQHEKSGELIIIVKYI